MSISARPSASKPLEHRQPRLPAVPQRVVRMPSTIASTTRTPPHSSAPLRLASLAGLLLLAATAASQPALGWRMLEAASLANPPNQLLKPSLGPSATAAAPAEGLAEPANDPARDARLVGAITDALGARQTSGSEAPAGSPIANRSAEEHRQQQQQQPVAPTAPSTTGKILEAATGAVAAQLASQPAPNASAGQLEPSRSLNVALQLLKPRKYPANQTDSGAKTGDSSAKRQRNSQLSASALEQQIINQHARVHPSGGSHQRLLPTKHRGGSVASMLASSSSSVAPESSPLMQALVGHFKSGITSRSSIVKAISDNKLARTISSVGKTLGSNKYVAGAAAASALAALGLTVTKLLSPYLMAGQAGLLGQDPMMTSGSLASSSYYAPGERAQPAGGYLFTSSSNSNSNLGAAGLSDSLLGAQSSGSYAFAPAGAPSDGYSAADLVPSSPFDSGALQRVHPSAADEQPVYVAYRPESAPSGGRPSSAPATELSGHYSSFYANPNLAPEPLDSAPTGHESGAESGLLEATAYRPPVYQFGYVGAPTGGGASGPFARTANGRRSGAVALKLDEATRAKLYEHFRRQQQQQQQQQLLQQQQLYQQLQLQQAQGELGGLLASASSLAPVQRHSYAPAGSRADPAATAWLRPAPSKAQQQGQPASQQRPLHQQLIVLRPAKAAAATEAPWRVSAPATEGQLGQPGQQQTAAEWRPTGEQQQQQPNGRPTRAQPTDGLDPQAQQVQPQQHYRVSRTPSGVSQLQPTSVHYDDHHKPLAPAKRVRPTASDTQLAVESAAPPASAPAGQPEEPADVDNNGGGSGVAEQPDSKRPARPLDREEFAGGQVVIMVPSAAQATDAAADQPQQQPQQPQQQQTSARHQPAGRDQDDQQAVRSFAGLAGGSVLD